VNSRSNHFPETDVHAPVVVHLVSASSAPTREHHFAEAPPHVRATDIMKRLINARADASLSARSEDALRGSACILRNFLELAFKGQCATPPHLHDLVYSPRSARNHTDRLPIVT